MARAVAVALVLACLAAVAYGPALNLPFIGDDYVFLDRTRTAAFADLWSRNNTDFGWYRPWSREFHFWVLQRLAGLQTSAFRGASMLLWIAALSLYAALVHRLASGRVAVIATLGVASLALWGSPLLWISGSQDLWMLCFAMCAMLLFVQGRTWMAVIPFGFALLSKETSAVLPAVLFGFVVMVEHRSVAAALRRTAHFWAIALLWLLVHPTLGTRMLAGQAVFEPRPPFLVIALKTVLSSLNLHVLPRMPSESGEVWRILMSTAVLALGASVLLREETSRSSARAPVAWFAVLWMGLGWLPLLLPSISWHAYYGCLGALGAWFALALWLEKRPRVAIGMIAGLAVLGGLIAGTPSWDWGSEWYQRRAGNLLEAIRVDLVRQHPTLPPYSRVYFAHIPNNIGLIAGQSPALRVWYRDPTLRADFYSAYRPRLTTEQPGTDLFFRFDSLARMVEIKAGAENVRLGLKTNPLWEDDHEKLAMLFVRGGDPARAAREFEKLSMLPPRPDAAVYAGVCLERSGDGARAEALFAAAQARLRLTDDEMDRWTGRLRESFPGPGQSR